ncbi:helix-turn-helix domain-containing protein [Streptomyces sp. JNUCC 64]
MSSGTRPDRLGTFLRERRAELSPGAVGLPDTGRPRRVRGLRREEVAALAALSTGHYTRLEQGRARASTAVLHVLARALRLDDVQRARMFALAGRLADRPPRRTPQRTRPGLRRLLDGLTAVPGVVLGRHTDVLAWNPLAAALVTDFARLPEKHRNYTRLVFTDPTARELYADWERVAHLCVARLRAEADQDPGSPRLAALVGELSLLDADFRRWWAVPQGAAREAGTMLLRHPLVGELTLDHDVLTTAADPGQRLVVWSAEPGSPSHDALRILASWNPGPNATTVTGEGSSPSG